MLSSITTALDGGMCDPCGFPQQTHAIAPTELPVSSLTAICILDAIDLHTSMEHPHTTPVRPTVHFSCEVIHVQEDLSP